MKGKISAERAVTSDQRPFSPRVQEAARGAGGRRPVSRPRGVSWWSARRCGVVSSCRSFRARSSGIIGLAQELDQSDAARLDFVMGADLTTAGLGGPHNPAVVRSAPITKSNLTATAAAPSQSGGVGLAATPRRLCALQAFRGTSRPCLLPVTDRVPRDHRRHRSPDRYCHARL